MTPEQDDINSRGKTLALPNAPWYAPPDLWRPTPWKLDRTPFPRREQDIVDHEQAIALGDAAINAGNATLRQEAEQAYAASVQAAARMNATRREQLQVSGPPPKGATVDERTMWIARRAALASLLAEQEAEQAALDQRCAAALDAWRYDARWGAGRSIIDAAEQEIAAMLAEAERLTYQAAHRRIVVMSAESRINASLPVVEIAPGLFNR